MNKETQNQIYKEWLELETRNKPEAQISTQRGIYEAGGLNLNEKNRLQVLRRQVFAYCKDQLESGDLNDLEQVVKDPIQCICDTEDCTKCLLGNCKDDECYFHPIEKKQKFRINYKNRMK